MRATVGVLVKPVMIPSTCARLIMSFISCPVVLNAPDLHFLLLLAAAQMLTFLRGKYFTP